MTYITMSTSSIPAFTGDYLPGFDNLQSVALAADGTKIAVWKDSTNTTTLKVATLTAGQLGFVTKMTITTPMVFDRVCIAQFANGDLAVVIRNTNLRDLRYAKITYATWTLSAWETVDTITSPNTIGTYDVDVSDNGVVLVSYMTYNGSSATKCKVQARGTAGTWNQPSGTLTIWNLGDVRSQPEEDCSVVALNASGGVLNVALAAHAGGDRFATGYQVYSFKVNESSGTQNAAPVLRKTILQGMAARNRSSGRVANVRLYRTTGNTFVFAAYTIPDPYFQSLGCQLTRAKYTWDGATWTEEYGVDTTYGDAGNVAKITAAGLSMDANENIVAHQTRSPNTNFFAPLITAHVNIWDAVNEKTIRTATGLTYFYGAGPAYSVSDGPRRNLSVAHLDFMAVQYWTSTSIIMGYGYEEVPGVLINFSTSITSISPSNGSTNQVANPKLTAVVDTGQMYSQSEYRMEFQFAKDSAFTTSVVTYRQDYSKGQQVNGTNTDGVTVTFSDTLPSAYTLSFGTWYYRARLVDLFGNVGLWTPAQTFAVGHPPNMIPTSPKGGGYYAWNGGSRTFTWDFSDPSPTDYQTAFELLVYDSTNTLIHDSGKVVSSTKSYTPPAFAAGYKDTDLTWMVRGWDSNDDPGPYCNAEWFNLTDMPTATIQTPTVNQQFANGIPSFVFTPTTGGNPARTIKEYTIVVTQGANIVWAERYPVANLASGTQQTVKMDAGYLQNNNGYSVQIFVTDSTNVQGVSPVVAFTVSWVPPASPTGLSVDTSNYNLEDEGYVLVSWNDTARDPDFTSWYLERKADMIDASGVVIQEGTWEGLFRDYATGSLYAYKDFFAPAGHRVSYRVTQSINRGGQDMDSAPAESLGVFPQSDGYWLIEPLEEGVDASAFKLSIVTGDSFTDEQEEEEFTVIGRGRVVNKGQRLGNKGSLDIQLRDTGGSSARQKRLRLIELQQVTRQVYLRNPFGDIFKVNVSGMSISRIAGVGHSEFCDVTIPYSEVS